MSESKPKKTADEKLQDAIDIEERTVEGMRIRRIGRGHYKCHSSSEPEVAYVVDLSDNDGLGSCQCDNFIYRLYPRWKKICKPYNVFRCKHLIRVRNHVMDQLIAHFKDKQPNHK